VPERQRSGAARVLVVDDDPSIVDAVATALRYEGYTVEEASNGRDAFAAVEHFEPDLVILDWALPDIEGVAISRRLREQGLRRPGRSPTYGRQQPREGSSAMRPQLEKALTKAAGTKGSRDLVDEARVVDEAEHARASAVEPGAS
jgi:CheY-like chemotaxis protein